MVMHDRSSSAAVVQPNVVSSPSTFQLTALRKLPKQKLDSILDQIRAMEKRNFPTNEAMEFSREFIARPNTSIAVIYENGQKSPELIAYAVWVRCHRKVLLHKICVHPSFRTRGFGTMLLSEIVAQANTTICPLELWVDAARSPARKLYNKFGFTETSRVQDYYAAGRTGIKMSLEHEKTESR